MREPNGRKVYSTTERDESPYVPADAISLLSGVNFGSVEKVLAAIELLRTGTGAKIDELASFYHMPTDKVSLHDPNHAVRARDTRWIVDRVVSEWIERKPHTSYEAESMDDLERVLHLESRFGGRNVVPASNSEGLD